MLQEYSFMQNWPLLFMNIDGCRFCVVNWELRVSYTFHFFIYHFELDMNKLSLNTMRGLISAWLPHRCGVKVREMLFTTLLITNFSRVCVIG